MKDYLQQLVSSARDNNHARCLAREYLQARILETLQNKGAFEHWAFVGGTALRFLYHLERFSEDLDFSTTAPRKDAHFKTYLEKLKGTFESEGYLIAVTAKLDKIVQSSFIKFPELLNELGLSPHRSEQISIKVEIDTNPPPGATLTTTVVRHYSLLNLLHYDKASLFAGKLHAIFSRRYVKGRDLYDLVWYLSDRTWPAPNLTLLNNALKQTMTHPPQLNEQNWRNELSKKISTFNWKEAIADIKPFIEKQEQLELLSKENILRLLHQ